MIECHRYDIPFSSRKASKHFLNLLQELDKKLELFWHPVRKRWELYLIKLYGATSSDDWLFFQLSFNEEPGEWVVTKLKKGLYKNTLGGKLNDEEMRVEWHRKSRILKGMVERFKKERIQDVSRKLAEEIERYVVRGRVVTSPWSKKRNGNTQRCKTTEMGV